MAFDVPILGGYFPQYYGGIIGQVIPTYDTPNLDKKPSLGPAETYGSQGVDYWGGSSGFGGLTGYGPRPISDARTYLSCLRDPVLAMARMYALNPIRAGRWRIAKRDNVPAKWVKAFEEQTKPLIPGYVDDAVWAVDFGWAGWQTVWGREDGKYVIERITACRQEANSGVLVDHQTGEPLGVRWNGIDLYGHRCFRYTHDRRGQNYAGRSRLENVIDAIWQWRESNNTSGKLGKKASGIVVGTGFPPGTTAEQAAKNKASAELFNKVITSGGGSFTFPTLGGLTNEKIASMTPSELIRYLELTMWPNRMIDLGDPGTSIASLTGEKEYLDNLKCLGYGVPPEAILQTGTGNRAKSEEHGAGATSVNEIVNSGIVEAFNRGVGDSFLVLRFGPKAKGSVWWEQEPLEDPQVAWSQKVFDTILSKSPADFSFFSRVLDAKGIAERQGTRFDDTKLLSESTPTDQANQGGQPDAIDAATSLDELEAAVKGNAAA